jgi:hypothetical protein
MTHKTRQPERHRHKDAAPLSRFRPRAPSSRVSQTETVENAPNWAISNLHVYEVGVAK